MKYFHKNLEESFSSFWRNSLKITEKKLEFCKKFENEKQKLLARTRSLIVNWYKKIQKIIMIISNSLSIIDKNELIDNYRSVSIFLRTLR